MKIGNKLLLGFGVVVFVFLVSVLMMWRSVGTVQATSNLLANGVAVASERVNALNSQAYELFLAMRMVQFVESEEAVAAYRKQLETVLALEKSVVTLNQEQPQLTSPAHVAKNVVPLTQQYIAIAEQNLAAVERKRVHLGEIRRLGQNVSTTSGKFMSALHDHMKDLVERGDLTALGSLTDAMELGDELRENAMAARRDMWQFIATFGTDETISRGLAARSQNMIRQLQELEGMLTSSPEIAAEVTQWHKSIEDYETELEVFMRITTEVNQLNEARSPMMASLNSEFSTAANMATTRLKEISTANEKGLGDATSIMLGSTLVAVVLAIAIALFIAMNLTRPLGRIVTLAERIRDGNLTVRREDFRYESRDEMGQMVEAVASMVEAQSDSMQDIVKTGGSLATIAGELAAFSEETNVAMKDIKTAIAQVTTLSESNGSALEESNAGVEEMSAGADTVAQSATDSAAFIAQTTEASNKAVQTVNNVIAGMRNVDKNSKESEEKTRQLVASVENVSSFVSVITGIADQTNLLALNAAIEAARAGEVGRGFAVVAEEVRKLAEESARAAQNVNGIIQELQTGAQASITATSEAGRLLVQTLDHAEQALQELNGALGQMQKANDSIQNIAAVAEEQAASSREVALAIDSATKSSIDMVTSIAEIDRATNETSEATKNVSVQAEHSLRGVHNLLRGISKFRVRTDEELADEILDKVQAHKDFAKKLFTIAETCEPLPLQTSGNLCALGILMSSSLPPRGYEHWWDKIAPVHEEFHSLGAEILKIVSDAKKSVTEKRTEAGALARRGDTLSKSVVKLLEDAAADIRTAKEVTRAKAQKRVKEKPLMLR